MPAVLHFRLRRACVLGDVVSHPDMRWFHEARLLQELPLLPDLQCAWLLLAMCSSPRASHILRTLPPDLSASYARRCSNPLPRPCCVRKLGHTPPHGSAPSPAGPAPLCPLTACSSHCGGGRGCPCLSHHARGPPCRVPSDWTARYCSPDAPSPPSTHGCASHARPLDRKARSCHSSGWRARPP